MEFEISLNNLKFYAYHGVFEEERRIGNEFIVNLSVLIPYKSTMEDDELGNTVSYAELYEILEEEMGKPRKLLESLTIHIVSRIKKNYTDIKSGEIRIEKVRPPIPGMIGSASVSLKF